MKSIPLLHFNIRDKLVIALLLLASIPLLIVGTYGVYYSIKTLEDSTLHYLEYEVSAKAQDVEKFLKNVHNDVLFLSQSGGIKAIVDYKGHPRSNDFNSIKNKVGNEFLAFATVRPYYYQIRYLNKGGHEIIRVDSDGKSFWIVPPEKLQFKGDRYYFTEAIKYNKGKCYVSPMDLNIEWGKIEVPHKPVVRVATPVFDGAGKKRGVVIINIFASYFIQQMQMTSIAKGGSTYLVNKEGFYLSRLNSQTSDSGFVLGSTDGLGKDFPKEIAAKILSGKKGTIKDPSRIISYGPIFTGDEISGDYWILVLEYPKMAIFTAVSKLRMVYIVIGIISMLASVAIGIWMAQRLTKPILELHKGAEWIADGDFEHKLDIRTGDEIEGLARQFNSMADNLKESRERILKWNEELRQEVEKRTHELEVSHRDLLVEKNKLASILMCAKEGIIVADEQDRVIILNPAAETMLGVKEGDVLGKSIFTCHKDPHNVAR
ncbi:MAG TPA: hypothetical protein DD641_07895, partial [Deltaproteobacteria bacterium]|nr:hypothetical protein [Deltaproteobacteria bacterium]